MIKFKDNVKNDYKFLRVYLISTVTYELLCKLDRNNDDIGAVYNYKEYNKVINEHAHIMDEIRGYLCNQMNNLVRYDYIDTVQQIKKINCLSIENTYFLYIGGYYYLTNDMEFIQKYIKR